MNKKFTLFGLMVCGLGALFYCYEYFLRIAPSVMSQELTQSFNVSAAAFGNLVAMYYYIYTPMQLPAGLLMDRFGPRRLLAIAALVCAIGSFLFAHGSLHLALIGRLLIGFGSAFAFVGTLRLAVSWLPASMFALITGSVTTLGMLGASSGDFLLSFMVRVFNWHNTIYISAIAGLIIAALIWFTIPNKSPDTSDATSSQSTVTFAQLFKEFAVLVRKPELWLIGLVGCLFYMPISVFAELWGIPFLKQAHGLTNAAASSVVAMLFLGEVFGGPLTGGLADLMKNRTKPIMVFSFCTAILISILLFVPNISKNAMYVLFFFIGMFCTGQNLVFPIACKMTDQRLAGTAMAMTNMLVMLGGVIFQPLVGVFLELSSGKHVKGDLSVYTGRDFQHALLVLPIALVITFIIMFFVNEKKSQKLAKQVNLVNSPVTTEGLQKVKLVAN